MFVDEHVSELEIDFVASGGRSAGCAGRQEGGFEREECEVAEGDVKSAKNETNQCFDNSASRPARSIANFRRRFVLTLSHHCW